MPNQSLELDEIIRIQKATSPLAKDAFAVVASLEDLILSDFDQNQNNAKSIKNNGVEISSLYQSLTWPEQFKIKSSTSFINKNIQASFFEMS